MVRNPSGDKHRRHEIDENKRAGLEAGLSSMSHRPVHPIQNVVHRRRIELLGVKRPASPSPEMVEFLMPRLEDDLQEFLVA